MLTAKLRTLLLDVQAELHAEFVREDKLNLTPERRERLDKLDSLLYRLDVTLDPPHVSRRVAVRDAAYDSEARLRNMEGTGDYDGPRSWP